MIDRIVKTHHFEVPIQKVWEAISQAEKISEWFIQADFKAEVGYRYTFTHDNTKILGEVLQADPVYNLVYTWKVSGTDVDTTVRWKLEEREKGTYLTLEHSGISNYPGESAVKMFENFKNGWDSCVNELEQYLN